MSRENRFFDFATEIRERMTQQTELIQGAQEGIERLRKQIEDADKEVMRLHDLLEIVTEAGK